MNKGSDNIGDLLLEIIGASTQKVESYSIVGTVIEVNEDERSCSVRPSNDDADIVGVRLQASIPASEGIFIKPKVGSFVIVTFMNSNTGYVSTFTEIDGVFIDTPETAFNGGDNGGLINVVDLVDRLNKIESDINDIKLVFSTFVPVPGDGGAALKTSATTWSSSTLTETNRSDVEDEAVKH